MEIKKLETLLRFPDEVLLEYRIKVGRGARARTYINCKYIASRMGSKKIIVRNTSQDDDEHTYYAIVFIQPDITMNKRLEFNKGVGKLEAEFTFWSESPLAVGEKFLVILASVEESEETDAIDSRFPAKSSSDEDIIDFNFHP